MRNTLIGLLLLVVVGVLVATYALSATPQVKLESPIKAVGTATPVKVQVDSPHGVRKLSAWLEQSGKRYTVFETTQPTRRLSFFRTAEAPREFSFTAGKQQAPDLKEGPARFIAEAVANDFAARTATVTADVQITLQPPAVSADGFQHYINQGGT